MSDATWTSLHSHRAPRGHLGDMVWLKCSKGYF